MTATSDKSGSDASASGAHEGGDISVGGSSPSDGGCGSGSKGKGNDCATGANSNEDNEANSPTTTSTDGSNRNDSPIGGKEGSSASGGRIGSGHTGGMAGSKIDEQSGDANDEKEANISMTASSSDSNSNVSPIGANEGSNASDGGSGSGHKSEVVYDTTEDKPAGVENFSGIEKILNSSKNIAMTTESRKPPDNANDDKEAITAGTTCSDGSKTNVSPIGANVESSASGEKRDLVQQDEVVQNTLEDKSVCGENFSGSVENCSGMTMISEGRKSNASAT